MINLSWKWNPDDWRSDFARDLLVGVLTAFLVAHLINKKKG